MKGILFSTRKQAGLKALQWWRHTKQGGEFINNLKIQYSTLKLLFILVKKQMESKGSTLSFSTPF